MTAKRKFNYEAMSVGDLFFGCLNAKGVDLVETARWIEACASSGWCGWAHEGDAFQGSTNAVATWMSSLADTIMFRALKSEPHDPSVPNCNAQRFDSPRQAFVAWCTEEAAPKRGTDAKPTPYLDWMAERPADKREAT